jgi:hypothetical protein
VSTNGCPAFPIASTHLFRYRSLRDAARSLMRDRDVLARADGLLFRRLVFVGSPRREGFTIGLVDPRRQMATCLWKDEAALAAFKARSPIARAWREDTAEYCEILLEPFRTHGTYRGHEPLAGLRARRPGEGPAVMWTFANIAPRNLWFFWRGIHRTTPVLLDAPGVIAGTAGPEHMYRGAMTFTIWERPEDALSFAYRESPHGQIVKDVRADSRLVDSMFIRFRPYAASGSWPAYSRFADRFDAFAAQLTQRAPAPGPLAPTEPRPASPHPTA